jgi:hypothetical protein
MRHHDVALHAKRMPETAEAQAVSMRLKQHGSRPWDHAISPGCGKTCVTMPNRIATPRTFIA